MSAQNVEAFSDDARLAALYEEFSEDDQTLAEAGISDFVQGLVSEDSQ
jgi:hypothetical protein